MHLAHPNRVASHGATASGGEWLCHVVKRLPLAYVTCVHVFCLKRIICCFSIPPWPAFIYRICSQTVVHRPPVACEPYAGCPWNTVNRFHIHFNSYVIARRVHKHFSKRACQSVRWRGITLVSTF